MDEITELGNLWQWQRNNSAPIVFKNLVSSLGTIALGG